MPSWRELHPIARGLLVALLLVALALPLLVGGDAYLLKLASRILILGLAAAALDLVLGTAGLVSFGHAAFLGLGGYVVGIMFHHDFAGTTFLGLPPTQNLILLLPAAMLVSGAFAGLTGLVCLRTRGVSFIMITLAFAQMLYFLFLSLPTYNGQDGIALWNRSHAAGLVDSDQVTQMCGSRILVEDNGFRRCDGVEFRCREPGVEDDSGVGGAAVGHGRDTGCDGACCSHGW